jgi:hypothetical protein
MTYLKTMYHLQILLSKIIKPEGGRHDTVRQFLDI